MEDLIRTIQVEKGWTDETLATVLIQMLDEFEDMISNMSFYDYVTEYLEER